MALALDYKEELSRKLRETWENRKYWYFNNSSYFSQLDLEKDTWSCMQYASLNHDGEVIGYLAYGIERECRYVKYLAIANFTDDASFGLDVLHMIKDIFEKYKYRKMIFSVIRGNPAEKKYDRLINRYGGKVVGLFKENVMLPDGMLYDEKMYEIHRADYLKYRENVNNAQ